MTIFLSFSEKNGEHYPCLDDLEGLVAIGRDPAGEDGGAEAAGTAGGQCSLLEREGQQTFLKKNSQHSLLEVK